MCSVTVFRSGASASSIVRMQPKDRTILFLLRVVGWKDSRAQPVPGRTKRRRRRRNIFKICPSIFLPSFHPSFRPPFHLDI